VADRAGARPTVLLAFDAADGGLVLEGIGEGWLPGLRSLLARGRWVTLLPPEPRVPAASWPSTVTGSAFLEHRVFGSRRFDPDTLGLRRVRSSDLARPPFWRYISEAGVPSTIVSAYGASPVRPFLGTQVLGWGTADPYNTLFRGSWIRPAAARRILGRHVGWRDAGYYLEDPSPSRPADASEYRARRLRSIDQQRRGLLALMRETEWRFFLGVFWEPHAAGHALWSEEPVFWGALRDVYRATDAALADLVAACPEDARVFVFTPHGMGPNPLRGEPLAELLERAGWLVRPAATRTAGPAAAGRSLRPLRRYVPRRALPWAYRIARPLRDLRANARAAAALDWARTRAFVVPYDLEAQIRLNVSGRERRGIVAPGREYDDACDELAGLLGELVHDATGARAVASVTKVAQLAGSVPRDGLPDLLVSWVPDLPITRLRAPGIGVLDVGADDPRRGQHRAAGFVVGSGPGIEPAAERASASLLDIAPTVLASLGVRCPAGLSGAPIPGLAPRSS
jgi:predicted AlkP superfamily phosphohydrolase/phosphomutase